MMELVRWNPLKTMSLLDNHFSRFFSDPFIPAEMAVGEDSRNVLASGRRHLRKG